MDVVLVSIVVTLGACFFLELRAISKGGKNGNREKQEFRKDTGVAVSKKGREHICRSIAGQEGR
jgi:hypothetical protein